MEEETEALYNEIKDKLLLWTILGGSLQAFRNEDTILIKGNAPVLSGAYEHLVPGEISLSAEGAKRFLETLDKVIMINKYLGDKSVSFKVTEGDRLVFAKDGKELSSGDISLLYQKLDMSEYKSTLPLELNMVKVKGLYERYMFLYEQVVKKRDFLESYNELISSFKGKREAIQFAKRNKGTMGIIRPNTPSREFDVLGDEDIVDTIINGENISFSKTVPLENRNQYTSNLENYELRVNNLIERLEQETERLEDYNNRVSAILTDISKCNVFNVRPITELPEYNCVSLDDMLSEEKERYDRTIDEKKYASSIVTTSIDEEYPWLRDINEQQDEKLNRNEKNAIILYKSFMYHLFNNIISYVRSNNLSIDEVQNDEYVESLVKKEYYQYVAIKSEPKNAMNLFGKKNERRTVVDDFFPSYRIVSYEEFKKIAFDHLPLLEPALSKVTLSHPITVYRCVHEPKDKNIYNADLGNAFLSTTTSVRFVSDFLDIREGIKEGPTEKVIYKIELPERSPIVAYTDNMFNDYGNSDVGFGEDQKEILIDSTEYDFEYVDADFNRLKDDTYLHMVTLRAIPKMEKTIGNPISK